MKFDQRAAVKLNVIACHTFALEGSDHILDLFGIYVGVLSQLFRRTLFNVSIRCRFAHKEDFCCITQSIIGYISMYYTARGP